MKHLKCKLKHRGACRSCVDTDGHWVRQVQYGPNDKGFALIATLSLLAFVFLLIVAMATMVSIEISTTSASVMSSRARQNALLGLEVGLAELQKQLGPDQRVTASASRMDTNPYDRDDWNSETDTLSIDGVEQVCQRWTGVWDTSRGTDGYVGTAFRKWLVSGDGVASEDVVLTGNASLAGAVVLEEGNTPVEAEKVAIGSGGLFDAYYAYWIDDEGAKAKVNADNASMGTSVLSAEKYGLRAIEDLEFIASGSSSLTSKVDTLPAFELVAESRGGVKAADGVKNHQQDITFYSYGVLANTADGGLKQDLTTGLYDSTSSPSGLIFGPVSGSASSNEDPGGPEWAQLRSWVNHQPDEGTGELSVQASTATQAGAYPILAGFQLYIVPTYSVVGTEVKIYFNIMPSVILWNPYDVPLESNDYVVSLGRTSMNGTSFYEFRDLWTYVWYKLKINGTDYTLTDSSFKGSADFFITSGRMEPGEAIVFSPPAGVHTSYDVANPQPSGATLERGYHPGYSFYFDSTITLPGVSTSLDYIHSGYTSGAYSIRLCQGTNAHLNVLQTAVFLNDRPVSQNFSGTLPMQALPGAGSPLGFGGAIGFKAMHVFTDNDEFWPSAFSGSILLPSSRKWLSEFNPRARLHGAIPFIYENSSVNCITANPSFAANTARGTNGENIMAIGFSDIGGLVDVAYPGIDQAVLFQPAPVRGELRSIAQLSQAPLFNELSDFEGAIRDARFGNLIPAYAIGNARADSLIELDEVSRDWSTSYTPANPSVWGFSGIHYDYSYKLNNALWDEYFFSTLPGTSSDNWPEDPRIRVVDRSSMPTSDMDTVAAGLLVDGPFNINSTSVAAWKALLASFYDTSVTRKDGSVDSPDPDVPRSPLVRLDEPTGGVVDDSGGLTDDEVYIGYRQLDDDQISDLAEAIVEEVKLRGPFGGMAQFVNRMPDRDGTYNESVNAFRLKGALTAAIDKTDINGVLQDSSVEATNSGTVHVIAEAEEGWRSEDLPGWLNQVDILSRVGNVLSARSDTFRIRAYGESVNSVTGDVAIARCEAVVQRMPEYVDSNNNSPEDAYGDLTPINKIFGRRFVVVSFRWLSEDEI